MTDHKLSLIIGILTSVLIFAISSIYAIVNHIFNAVYYFSFALLTGVLAYILSRSAGHIKLDAELSTHQTITGIQIIKRVLYVGIMSIILVYMYITALYFTIDLDRREFFFLELAKATLYFLFFLVPVLSLYAIMRHNNYILVNRLPFSFLRAMWRGIVSAVFIGIGGSLFFGILALVTAIMDYRWCGGEDCFGFMLILPFSVIESFIFSIIYVTFFYFYRRRTVGNIENLNQ